MTHRSILLATDLSARCDRPLDRALLLKQQLGAELLAVHVPAERPLSPTDEKALRGWAGREYGEEFASGLLMDYGSVPATLARLAEEREVTLIVTGVARFNNLRDYVLGTAVDYLVRRSISPVLVVKKRARGPYARVLVGTDFSRHSLAALTTAAELFPEAELKLVNSYLGVFTGFLDEKSSADYVRREHEEGMDRFLHQLPHALRNRVTPKLAEGDVVGVLHRQIESWAPDLLVVGSHGVGGFAQAALGSKAAEVLSHAPVDVLVVRASA